MPEYQLEIKQIVDYPRCRIYREFVQALIADRSIRTNGGSGLFYFTVLCSYANFRTSYRRLDGITYTVYPRLTYLNLHKELFMSVTAVFCLSPILASAVSDFKLWEWYQRGPSICLEMALSASDTDICYGYTPA